MARIEKNEAHLGHIVEKINELIEENMVRSSGARMQKLCLLCNRGAYGSQRVCGYCIEERRPRFSSGRFIFWCCFLVAPGFAYKARKEMEQKEWDLKYL